MLIPDLSQLWDQGKCTICKNRLSLDNTAIQSVELESGAKMPTITDTSKCKGDS